MGTNTYPAINQGRFVADGQLTAFFEDGTLRDLFDNETEVSIMAAVSVDDSGTGDLTSSRRASFVQARRAHRRHQARRRDARTTARRGRHRADAALPGDCSTPSGGTVTQTTQLTTLEHPGRARQRPGARRGAGRARRRGAARGRRLPVGALPRDRRRCAAATASGQPARLAGPRPLAARDRRAAQPFRAQRALRARPPRPRRFGRADAAPARGEGTGAAMTVPVIEITHTLDRLSASLGLLAGERLQAAVRALNRTMTTVRAEAAREIQASTAACASPRSRSACASRAPRAAPARQRSPSPAGASRSTATSTCAASAAGACASAAALAARDGERRARHGRDAERAPSASAAAHRPRRRLLAAHGRRDCRSSSSSRPASRAPSPSAASAPRSSAWRAIASRSCSSRRRSSASPSGNEAKR
jgi:hypothetical protein